KANSGRISFSPNEMHPFCSSDPQPSLRPRYFLTPFENRKLLVQPSDHLTDAGFRQPLGGSRIVLVELLEPVFQMPQFVFRLLIFINGPNHNWTSTIPLRRPSGSRVLPKNSIHPCQSVSSSAANSSSGCRVKNMSSSSKAASSPASIRC